MSMITFSQKYRLRLRRSEDGERIIRGKYGEIYQHGDALLGVLVMPNGHRPRLWPSARRQLEAAGCQVWQDGDTEGTALFDPQDHAQAKLVIRLVGVKPKRRARLSPAFIAARDRFKFKPRTVEEGHEEAKSRGISPQPKELVEVGV